jgi:hypothetical protein
LAAFSVAVILFHGFSGARAYSAAAASAAASLASLVFTTGFPLPNAAFFGCYSAACCASASA